ncbi:MAG: hypothetical protein JNL86_17940 [Nitrospira sp.]|jgi:hypothetical protein|nr:hypothetical protein [Nitrospira sp.]MCC7472100.1 hypothetical protein [Candidatus Nomurabacteria bacterium]
MNGVWRSMHGARQTTQGPLLAVSLVSVLIVIRLAAAIVCATCFTELETPATRNFHLHGGGDREPCHRGQVEARPLVNWACSVNQDDNAFILPEIPRLPVVVVLFVPLVVWFASYRSLLLISATGRSPPRTARAC